VAERTARTLLETLARGGYAQSDPEAFAEALSQDLQSLTADRHASVEYAPGSRSAVDPEAELGAEEKAQLGRLLARQNFGVNQVRILPGNVGYLELRYFAPLDFATPVLAAAMRLVGSTDALVVDLRDNEGGDPRTVAFLATYFFAEGSRLHLADVHHRDGNGTRESWTSVSVPGPRYPDRPVYLLTSARTVSGGEELAYDLQVRKRATVVGETTGGVANTGQAIPLGAGLVAFIPTGRAINPITRTSWEGVGVRPDAATPATRAAEVAHAQALRAILASQRDGGYRQMLQRLLAMLEKGAPE
jgi:C-terminal processing protease CtpA/Prc